MHKTTNFTLRLLPEEREALDHAAYAKGMKTAEYARRILRKSLGLPVGGAVRESYGRPKGTDRNGEATATP